MRGHLSFVMLIGFRLLRATFGNLQLDNIYYYESYCVFIAKWLARQTEDRDIPGSSPT